VDSGLWVTTCAREDKREEKKETGCRVYEKTCSALFIYFFFLTPRPFDFSSIIVLNFPPRIFGEFCSRKQKGDDPLNRIPLMFGNSFSKNILVSHCGKISICNTFLQGRFSNKWSWTKSPLLFKVYKIFLDFLAYAISYKLLIFIISYWRIRTNIFL